MHGSSPHSEVTKAGIQTLKWLEQDHLLTLRHNATCNQLHTNCLTWKSYFFTFTFFFFFLHSTHPDSALARNTIAKILCQILRVFQHPQDDFVIYWSSLNYPYFKLLKQPYSWLWFLLISFYQSTLKTAQKSNYMQKFYLLYGPIFFYGVWDISCSSGLVCNREM